MCGAVERNATTTECRLRGVKLTCGAPGSGRECSLSVFVCRRSEILVRRACCVSGGLAYPAAPTCCRPPCPSRGHLDPADPVHPAPTKREAPSATNRLHSQYRHHRRRQRHPHTARPYCRRGAALMQPWSRRSRPSRSVVFTAITRATVATKRPKGSQSKEHTV